MQQQICIVMPESPLWSSALEYGYARLSAALLVVGDMMPSLRDLSLHAVAYENNRVIGVAVRFTGFSLPSFSVAADSSELADMLLCTLSPERGFLAVSTDQPLPENSNLTWTVDPWLRGKCIHDPEAEARSESPDDGAELAAFYQRMDSRYWCPAMLDSGRSRVIRNSRGAIVAAGSAQFVLPGQYAHIGALATIPTYRRQGYGGLLLSALRSTLARDGVQECGMFAEGSEPWLEKFYEGLGFRTVGQFRFAEIRSSYCLSSR